MIRKLNRQEYAYLRAIEGGLTPLRSAKQFLGGDSDYEAIARHQSVLALAKAIARQAGYPAWKSIGAVRAHQPIKIPDVDTWATAKNYAGFYSEREILTMYREAYPAPEPLKRASRAVLKGVLLINEMERLECAILVDANSLLADWFTGAALVGMQGHGLQTIGDLQRLTTKKQRWWRDIQGIGRTVGDRINTYLEAIFKPPIAAKALTVTPTSTALTSTYALVNSSLETTTTNNLKHFGFHESINSRAAESPWRDYLRKDIDIAEQWIAARANSQATAKSYRREIRRFIYVCHGVLGVTLLDVEAAHCKAYKAFIADVPDGWIGARVSAKNSFWRPFSGKLVASSQRLALSVITSAFAWFLKAGMLTLDPWILVNTKVADDGFNDEVTASATNTNETVAPPISRTTALLSRKFFSMTIWLGVVAELARVSTREPVSLSAARTYFACVFLANTGLRSQEFLALRFADIFIGATAGEGLNTGDCSHNAYVLRVFGKGAKVRLVPVPSVAVKALNDFVIQRKLGLNFGAVLRDTERLNLPIFPNLLQPILHVSYNSFIASLQLALITAINECPTFSFDQKAAARCFTPHWFRRSYVTSAVAAGVPLHVVARILGHSKVETTLQYIQPSVLDDGALLGDGVMPLA